MIGSDYQLVIQAAAEKPEKSRHKKYCLAMKKMELEQMEGVNGGMSCGLALGFYGVALIGAAAATGGLAIAAGLITLGGSIWTAFESCNKST
jgi:hypothetical protein